MQNYAPNYAISNPPCFCRKEIRNVCKDLLMLLEMSLPFFYFVWARFMKTLVFVRAISYASLDTASTEFNYKINSRTVKIKVRSST